MKHIFAIFCLLVCAYSSGVIGDGFTIVDASTPQNGCPVSIYAGVKESSNNYILSNNCNPLEGVSVTISITQDLVYTNGFGFQLNTDGMLNSKVSWQQYVMAVDGAGKLYATIDNWDTSGNQIFNQWVYLFTMPQYTNGTYYVPAGYEFTISLISNSNTYISGVTYYVVDGFGNVVANYSVALNALKQYDGGVYSNADIGPIGDVTLDIVGFDNSMGTVFTSGGGNIIYHSASPLTVTDTRASSCVHVTWTAEYANSMYSGLPTLLSTGDYIQSFTHCH